MLRDVPRLLRQAEKSPNLADREVAVAELWEVRDRLAADLKEAEAGLNAGTNRRVEIATLRTALSTLAVEMALVGLDRTPALS